MRNALLAVAITLAVVPAAQARDTDYKLKIDDVLQNAEYKARLAAAYPVHASGKTLFPFRRLFVVATR